MDAVENEANRFCELLLKLVSKTMDRDVSLEEFLEFRKAQSEVEKKSVKAVSQVMFNKLYPVEWT